MKQQNKIAICIPNNWGFVPEEFAMSIFKMQQRFYEWRKQEGRTDSLSRINARDFSISRMRNGLVGKALEAEQTHLLFLDVDMEHDADMIWKMIKNFDRQPNADAICGLYTWKQPPYVPHIFGELDEETKKFKVMGEFPLDKLFQVTGTGMGCIMIKADVFKRIKRPWFKFLHKEDDWEFTREEKKALPHGAGEDLYFFWKSGAVTLCDPTIQSKHIGKNIVSVQDYIDYNNLQRTENFVASREELDRICDEHEERNLKKH